MHVKLRPLDDRARFDFSSTDILRHPADVRLKAHAYVEFEFVEFQLDAAIRSEDGSHIEGVCRNKLSHWTYRAFNRPRQNSPSHIREVGSRSCVQNGLPGSTSTTLA